MLFSQVLSTIQVTNPGEKAAATDALQAAVESAEVDKMDTTNIMFSSTSTHSQRQQQQTAGYCHFEYYCMTSVQKVSYFILIDKLLLLWAFKTVKHTVYLTYTRT